MATGPEEGDFPRVGPKRPRDALPVVAHFSPTRPLFTARMRKIVHRSVVSAVRNLGRMYVQNMSTHMRRPPLASLPPLHHLASYSQGQSIVDHVAPAVSTMTGVRGAGGVGASK